MTTYDRKVRQPAAQPGQSAQTPEALLKPKVPAGGPLTRLVKEAKRPARAGQAGETNWTEVAQAVTTRYHELEGKVSAVDLLGAIRELPEGGVQELVISGVGGEHAEQLKLALRSPAPEGKTTTPSPLPRLRAVIPGAAGKADSSPASAPTTATAASAATKVPATGKAAEKGKIAKAPTSPKAKGKTPAKAPSANPRARLQRPQRQAGPQGTPAKGVQSATPQAAPAGHATTSTATPGKKGGAGQAGNLIVAHRDEFKGLNVTLKPSMERGGKLVFSPAAWRATEKNVQQELKKRQPLHARNLQGRPQAQQASPQSGQPRQVRPQHAPRAKQPLKVPSATIKAAEIKKHEQQNRQKNQARLKSVVAQANKTRSAIASVQPKATAQISAAQKGAEASITAALQKTLGQIRSAEASARSAVTAKASAATARVTSAHQATVQGIRQDTTQKVTTLKQSAQTLKAQLTAEKARMDTGVRGEFNKASATARTIGAGQASSARSTGQSYAARYRNEPLPEQNALQKLANGDDYHAKKREAKVQAALDVSSSYATELTKAGGDQASQIMQSLPDALASNQTILNEYQKQLDSFVQTQVTALQTQQQNAITQANQQRTSLISQINAQRSQALSGITQAASQGRSQATSQANSKKQTVRAQGQQAVKGVTSSVKQAQAQMQGRIQGFQQAMQGKLTLDAPEFARAVSGFESYAQKGGTQAQAQVTRSASASTARLKAAAAPAAQALSSLGQGTASSLKAQGTQTGAALTALANSGATGLKQALTSHQQATRAAVTGAQQQFKTFSEGIRKDGEKTVKDVNTQLEKTADPFRDALTEALAKEPGDIEAKASEASNAVQPRWKGILKVVIDVVIVVATIAATIALAAVLGPVGLVLAGMAIGALGAVVGQSLKDAVDGKFSGWEAYGAAALGGAIGGAFGGAGGAVGNILAKGAVKAASSGLTKGAIRVGVEGVVGTGFDLAGQVATGYTNQAVFNQPYKLSDTFNVKNVAMTGVMNTAGTALSSPSAVKYVGGKLSNINIPGKGLLGKFQNTLSNSRAVKVANTLDNKITSSTPFTRAGEGLERAGELLGTGLTGKKPSLNTPGQTTFPSNAATPGKGTPKKTPANPEGNPPVHTRTDDPLPLSTPRAPGESQPPHQAGATTSQPRVPDRDTPPPRGTADTQPEVMSPGAAGKDAPGHKPQPEAGPSDKTRTPDQAPDPKAEVAAKRAAKKAENEGGNSAKSIESSSASGDLSERGYKPQPGERSTTRQEWKNQNRLERIRESRLRVEQELNARMQTRIDQIPDGAQKKRMLDLLRQVDELDFSTRPDQASVYSGRVGDVSNRDLALEHMERGGDAIDGTPGGKWLESQDLYTVFKPDYELADLVWMKASMKYARGAQGDIHTFVDGASPERVFHTVEKPLLQSNADVERWVRHRNSGKKEVTPQQDSTSSTPTNQKTSTNPSQTSSDKSAVTRDNPANRQNELLNGLPENLRSQIPVERDPTLNGNTVKVDYSFSSRGVEGIRIKVGPDATPRDIELHARTVTTLQKYSGLQGRVRSLLERITTRLGLKHVPPPGSRAWEAKHELEKLSGIIQDRQATLAVTTDSTQRIALENELTSLEAQVQLHENALGNLHDGNGYIAMLSTEDLKLITTRPDEFRASTKDILMKRQPDLHSTRDHLNHDVIGDVSRNHIVAFGHTRLVMLNNLLSRDNSEIFDFMTRLGRNPLSQADKDLSKNVRQLMLDLYNSSNNLYVGPSIQNSAAGNRMKLLMGERLKLTAEPDSSTFRDLTKRYVKEAVDVPPGVSNGSGKDVSDNATQNAKVIDELYRQWDSFEDIRREAFRIRSGEISPDEISIDMLLAQGNLRDLRSHIEQLLPDLHGGSIETNAFLRSKLEKALELEILLTEATNAVNLRGEVIP